MSGLGVDTTTKAGPPRHRWAGCDSSPRRKGPTMSIGITARRASAPVRASETFRMVPDRLWTHPDLQPFDLKLWCAMSFLARGRGRTDATDKVIAHQADASPQTVRRGLQRLESAAFISRAMDGRDRIITLNPEGTGEPIAGFTLKVAT